MLKDGVIPHNSLQTLEILQATAKRCLSSHTEGRVRKEQGNVMGEEQDPSGAGTGTQWVQVPSSSPSP